MSHQLHFGGSDCAPSDWAPSSRQAVVNESTGDERLATVAVIVAVVVVVAMVGMVVAVWTLWGVFNKI